MGRGGDHCRGIDIAGGNRRRRFAPRIGLSLAARQWPGPVALFAAFPGLLPDERNIIAGGLWALGLIQLGDLPTSWVSWWVGDTLGVLVILP